MSLVTLLKKLHKWFAIIVGIQLLIWVVSGLVFSFIKHKEVGGNFIFKNQQKDALLQSADFSRVFEQFPNAKKISLISLHQKTAFKIELEERITLIDSTTYKIIKPTEPLIKDIAQASYRGGGELHQVKLIEERDDENRGMRLPTWQLVYNDQYNSHLYFSAESGEFQGVRTDNWRIFDFFMMLHFMDFGERGNFNNSLIIFFACLLVLFSLSGLLLIYSSFSLADFTHLLHRFVDKRKVKLIIRDQHGQQQSMKVTKDTTLLDALYDQHVNINSDCGGGGICGTCRVKVVGLAENRAHDLSEHDLSKHEILSDQEINQGYRLACQLVLEQKLKIELDQKVDLNARNKP